MLGDTCPQANDAKETGNLRGRDKWLPRGPQTKCEALHIERVAACWASPEAFLMSVPKTR